MGIDIYARWDDQTPDEAEAQITGFDVTMGSVGYLREAYHGEPYATEYLVREAFESPNGTAAIPAAALRERLPHTIELAMEREREVYGHDSVTENDAVIRSFVAFVELCEKQERRTRTPVTIEASY